MISRLLRIFRLTICYLLRALRWRQPARRMIELTNNLDRYNGNNSTVTAYPITFRFDANSWLTVQRVDADGTTTTLVLGVDYAISGDGKTAAASLTTTAAVPVSSTVTVSRYAPAVSLFHPETGQPLSGTELERVVDQIVMAMQDRDLSPGVRGSRALILPPSEPPGNPNMLPVPDLRKEKIIWGHPETGAVIFAELQEIAPRLLAYFGGAPSSQDVLAAIGAVSPIKLLYPPTTATPGKFGQLAILNIGLPYLEVGGLTYGGSPLVIPKLYPAGISSGKTVYSSAPSEVNPEYEVRWMYPIGGGTPFWNLSRWVGLRIVYLTSTEDVSSPDLVSSWTLVAASGTPDIIFRPPDDARAWMNVAYDDSLPHWVELPLPGFFQQLPTSDPEISGRLFLDGTALNVSQG